MIKNVAVIITNHNYAHRVMDAVDSVILQDYPRDQLRLVLVDDASQDGSQSVLESLVRDSPIPTCLFPLEAPQGPSGAHNEGLMVAWDWVDAFAFLDADDMYCREKISRSVEVMNQDPDRIGLVYSDEIYQDEIQGFGFRRYREPFSWERLATNNLVGGNFLVNKRALEKVGFFDPTLEVAENHELALRMADYSWMLVHIPEPLHKVNLTTQSLRYTVPSEQWGRITRSFQEDYLAEAP